MKNSDMHDFKWKIQLVQKINEFYIFYESICFHSISIRHPLHFALRQATCRHAQWKCTRFYKLTGIRSDRLGRRWLDKLEPQQAVSFGSVLNLRKHCFRSRKFPCRRALMSVIILGTYRGRQLECELVVELVSDYVVWRLERRENILPL